MANTTPPTGMQERHEMAKARRGIIWYMAKVMVLFAVPLDVIATVVRLLEGAVSFKFPALYALWNAHTSPTLAIAYYIVEGIALVAIPIGVSAAALLTFPLLNIISKRIDAARRNRNRKVRKEMETALKQKQRRYVFFIILSLIPLGLFSISFFTAGYKAPTKTIYKTVVTTVKGKKHTTQVPSIIAAGTDLSAYFAILTFIADVTAPSMSMFVVMNMEGEADDVEAQEQAMSATTDIVVQQIKAVAQQAGTGNLTRQQAHMLKSGMEADIHGAIDAITPRDEAAKMYTIAQICRKLGVSDDPQGANYRKIQRIVSKAHDAGETDIRQDKSTGRARWMVPGKLLDELFADYEPSQEALRLVNDRPSTWNRSQVADEAV